MSMIPRPLRHAVRTLAKSPGSTLVAIATLALGIGSITPTFSLINAFLLRPLPFGEPERLVHVWETDRKRGWDAQRVALPNYRDWREQSGSFEDLAAFNYTSVTLTGGEDPERIASADLSANALEVLRVSPALGRGFLEGEDIPGNNRVVILNDSFWRTRYGADPAVLGRTLEIEGVAHTVVGVMPPEFVFPLPITELWIPYAFDEAATPRGHRWLQVVGRLAPGVSRQSAQADLDRIAASLAQEYPETNEHAGARIQDLRAALNFAHEIFQALGAVLLVANFLVLLTACANVSSLLLARSIGRRREMAIRSALGASRRELLGVFLTESLVLALAGGGLGVLLAAWSLDIIGPTIPADLYRVGALRLDLAALGFTLGVSVLAAVLSGLLPAWRASRTDPGDALKEEGRASTPGKTLRLQGALVTGQIALASLLLVGTGLMIRSVLSLRDVDPGFDAGSVLTMKVVLPEGRYTGAEEIAAFHEAVAREVRNTPGVESASTINFLPLNHETSGVEFSVSGADPGAQEDTPSASAHYVGTQFFRTLGIRRIAGRTFEERDRRGAQAVAVVNDAAVRRYWPDTDAVGRSITLAGKDEPVTIIGVVAATKHVDLAGGDEPQIYFPQAQRPWRYHRIVARVPGDPKTHAGSIRQAIWRVDRLLPITEVRSLQEVVEEFLLPQTSLSRALISIGAGALLLGIVGIYGLIGVLVGQRRKEIALRIALGARPVEVQRMVVGHGLLLAATGLVLGLAGSLAFSILMASFLFGVSPADPVTFLLVPLLVLAAVLLSCYGPALRASRTDPATVLRHQ